MSTGSASISFACVSKSTFRPGGRDWRSPPPSPAATAAAAGWQPTASLPPAAPVDVSIDAARVDGTRSADGVGAAAPPEACTVRVLECARFAM